MTLSFVLGLGLGCAQPVIMSLLYEAVAARAPGRGGRHAHHACSTAATPSSRSPPARSPRALGMAPVFWLLAAALLGGRMVRARQSRSKIRRHETNHAYAVPGREPARQEADQRRPAPADRGRRARLQGDQHARQQGRARRRARRAGDARTSRARCRRSSTCSSNEILLEANEWGGHLAAMASEEMERSAPIPTRYPQGEYLLLFDPLDGSSNIDVNVSVGTIFSVLRCPKPPTAGTASRTSRPSCSRAASRSPPASRSTARPRCSCSPSATACTASRSTARRALRATHPDIRIPRGHAGIRHQHVEHAPLGAAGEALHRRMPGRQGRPARQGLQHALGRLDGGRRVPHPVARRHLHVPARRARTRTGSCA